MEIIQQHLTHFDETFRVVALRAPRLMLRKRRWRGVAEDGREFGFDLIQRLEDGGTIFQDGEARVRYVMEQLAEPVLEIPLSPADPGPSARLGWLIGNLHFGIEVVDSLLRCMDDPAVRQLFARERLAFAAVERVFHPISGGHSHADES